MMEDVVLKEDFGLVRWVITLPSKKNAGSLYRLEKDYVLTPVLKESVTISNGIVWNSEGTKMYYIDTPTGCVDEFTYDKNLGAISDRKTVITTAGINGSFDGSAIDSEGKIWIALWGGEGVGRFDPKSGKLIELVKTPLAKQTSSCAFGGKDLNELYITTSREGLTEHELAEQPLAGSVFKYKTSVSGVEPYYFG
jgi:sugar lactone lactonase YvrE